MHRSCYWKVECLGCRGQDHATCNSSKHVIQDNYSTWCIWFRTRNKAKTRWLIRCITASSLHGSRGTDSWLSLPSNYIWNEPLLRVALSESSWIVNLVYQLIIARSVFATLRFPTFNAFTDSPDNNSRSFHLLIIRAATVLSSLKSECQLGYFTILQRTPLNTHLWYDSIYFSESLLKRKLDICRV